MVAHTDFTNIRDKLLSIGKEKGFLLHTEMKRLLPLDVSVD